MLFLENHYGALEILVGILWNQLARLGNSDYVGQQLDFGYWGNQRAFFLNNKMPLVMQAEILDY